MFKKTKKNKIDIVDVNVEDIKFTIDDSCSIKDISFKGKVLIPHLCFFDKLHLEVMSRFQEEDILIDPSLFNKLKASKFDLSIFQKKKESSIIGSTEIVHDKIKIKYIINIVIKKDNIIISTRTAANRKAFYGVSLKVDLSNIKNFKTSNHILDENKLLSLPFKEIKYIHDGDTPNQLIFKDTQIDMLSSYESYFLNEKELVISPAIYGKKKKVVNSWRLRPNKIENSFHVLKMTFKSF